MRLIDIIHANLIIPQMRSRNKWDAIEELVDQLVEEHEIRIFDQHEVLEAVLTREKSLSTGLNDHVALPHGRTLLIDDLIGVLGIAPEGIPFESRDGKDAKLLCLLVIPENQYHEHIQTLASISRLLCDVRLRTELIKAGRSGSRERVLQMIENTEGSEFLLD